MTNTDTTPTVQHPDPITTLTGVRAQMNRGLVELTQLTEAIREPAPPVVLMPEDIGALIPWLTEAMASMHARREERRAEQKAAER